jgi:hypothetical protein
VQQKANGDATDGDAQTRQIAARGVAGSGGAIPHVDRIAQSFGPEHAGSVQAIRAHVGGEAATAAHDIGALAYATGDSVAFASSPDLHTAAHEAAHVVQQKAGVQLKGGVGQVGDAYEQHADAVADAVVRGESAAPILAQAPTGSVRTGVQRFVEPEHKELGDVGSGGQTYKFGKQEFTHGDIVMLSGDHFSPDELVTLLQAPSDDPGQRPGTQDELIYALLDNLGTADPRFDRSKMGKWAFMNFSPEVKKSVEKRYYQLASQNDPHFANPHPGVEGGPPSAGATYRAKHEAALKKAYELGQSGQDIQLALVIEGTGQHFLTDSFAAGHVSTPRTSINDHWNGKYPNFGQQFIDKVVNDITDQLGDDATGMSDLIPKSTIRPKVRDMINEKLADKPLPKLGDIVGLMTHEYDNDNGLWMVNDLGWRWRAFGDNHLHEGPDPNAQTSEFSNFDIATQAVQLGCDEVRTAYAYGKRDRSSPLPEDQLYDQIKQAVMSPAVAGTKYGPEQLMPRIDMSFDQGVLGWNVESLAALWVAKVRSTGDMTYGRIIVNDMQAGGTMGNQLQGIYDGLPDEINPFSEGWGKAAYVLLPLPTIVGHGHLFPQKAFKKRVIDRVRDLNDCLKFLLEIVGQ